MNIVKALRRDPKNFILRLWTYFRRGHSTYLVFFLSFANFIVIQYRLLIEYIPVLQLVFSSLIAFAIVFFAVYIPLAIIIGYYDYKKFAVPVDTALAAKASPWNRDLARALILIAEGRNKEAIEILKKWVE
ncbi:MAG: hypothetical protein DRH17_09115 [Deltaproteobacteria bacterium]|nr:MAG: hypothetical protein DRH17_09115 [Deltaproteobacteria bacterium]